MDLVRKVRQYILQQNMIPAGCHVLVGVSGGADSVCLLRILSELQNDLRFKLSAAHVHHGIRGVEADRDAAFAEDLCRMWGIPFVLYQANVPAEARAQGISTEEAGRQVRYRLFEEWRQEEPEEDRRIAVAHHMDDQAETVLLNLCRGTGIRGLGAMAPVRGSVIRPLLGVRREEIIAWLRDHGQPWCEDGTNASSDYTRNRIRHEILPRMEEMVNSAAVSHLAAAADQARELDLWLDEEAEKWISQEVRREGGEIRVRADHLRVIPGALQIRILHRLMAEAAGGARDLTSRHLTALISLVEPGKKGTVDLPGELQASRREETLVLGAKKRAGVACELPAMPSFTMEVFPLGDQKIPRKEYTKWFDYDKITGIVRMRPRQCGDMLCLGGVGHKSLQRYMIDAHIPAESRDQIPILADEEKVLWVVGYRMNAEVQVTETTKNILAVTVLPGER